MSGSFLDTTIVVDVAKGAVGASVAKKYIASHPPGQMAFYALRELLAGPVQIICRAHNIILAADNPGEALTGILLMPAIQGRKRDSVAREIARVLADSFASNPAGTRQSMSSEMLDDLALQAQRLWLKGRKIQNVAVVQPLSCFNGGELTLGEAGELRGPRGRFECLSSERCAAAGYIHDNKANLVKMINALHPSKLSHAAKKKNENTGRRVALKELHTKGPTLFSKRRCRALGDAYFAEMCPAGMDLITTNVEDFIPLCGALGKRVIKP